MKRKFCSEQAGVDWIRLRRLAVDYDGCRLVVGDMVVLFQVTNVFFVE
jgi:hypothetical protein